MNSFAEEIRDAAGMKRHAWTCTACHEPCPLVLVNTPEPRFRSACHVAPVAPTKGYTMETKLTYAAFMIRPEDVGDWETIGRGREMVHRQLSKAGAIGTIVAMEPQWLVDGSNVGWLFKSVAEAPA